MRSIFVIQPNRCHQAIAWSPHTSIHDLVAVGYAGRVDLLRLTLSSHSKISNSAICTLPVRTTKPCISLAFSSQKPTVLAAGFERTKNEPGLIVWDLGAYSSILSQTSRAHGSTAQSRVGDPTGKDIAAKNQYAMAEPVSSVAFLPDSSDILAASVSNTSLRLYDLRESPMKHSSVPFLIIPGPPRAGVISSLYIDPTSRYMLSAAGTRGWEGTSTEVLIGYEINATNG